MLEARDLASGVINRLRTRLGELTGTQKLLAGGLGTAAVGGTFAAYEIGKFADHSVKAAASFQQANTLLTTQAGVARSRITDLGNAFLELAPKLAQTPQALSEAFYHVASAGIPVREQLGTLKAAAEGAAVGNANLEDTVNSLVAAIRSGIGGIHGAQDAMATLMSIVGTGNMRLSDFNAAMGTGLPGTAKTFGLSLQSVGAALAFLTDTGMPASQAATRLRMSIALLGGPTQQSANVLKGLGLTSTEVASRFAAVSAALEKAHVTTTQLAADMRRPDGLVVALRDLKTRMDEAGLSASTQADVIARAFGGGHMGSAIMQLVQRLPAVAQKFDAIRQGVSSFGAHWQQTTKTAIFQAHSMHAAVSSIGTSIGTALLPAVQKLAAALVPVIARVAEFVAKHKTLAAIILGVAFGLSVLAAVVGTVGLAFMAFGTALDVVSLPLLGIIAAVAVLAVAGYEIYRHWGAIVHFFENLWTEVRKIFHEALDDISTWLTTEWNLIYSQAVAIWTDFKGWIGALWGDVRNEMVSAWTGIVGFLMSIWLGILSDLQSVWNAIKSFFVGLWNDVKGLFLAAWDAIKDVLTTVWDAIKGAALAVWDALVTFFKAVWDGLVDAWNASWSAIKSVLTTIWDALQAASAATWNAIRTATEAAWNALRTAAEVTWGAILSAIDAVWNALRAAAEATWNGIKFVLEAIWDGLKIAAEAAWNAIRVAAIATWNAIKVAATATWDAIKVALIAVWNALKVAAQVSWDAIKTAAVTISNAARAALTATWDAVRTALTVTWNALVTAATSAWSQMKAVWSAAVKWFGTFKTTVIGYFKDAGQWLVQAGEAIINGLWNGMKSVWNSVSSWLGSIGGAIKSLKGPLDKDMVLLQPEGSAIIKGLQAGMKSQMGPLTAMVSGIAPGIKSEVAGGVGPLAASGSSGGPQVVIEINNPQIWKTEDVDNLVNQIGTRLATVILPMSGMQVRRS